MGQLAVFNNAMWSGWMSNIEEVYLLAAENAFGHSLKFIVDLFLGGQYWMHGSKKCFEIFLLNHTEEH